MEEIYFICERYLSYNKVISKRRAVRFIITNAKSKCSISSNIAEGSKRAKNEFIHFIRISQGSAAELETQLFIAHNLGYINEKLLQEYVQKIEDILKMLSKLYQSLQTK